MPKGIGHRSTSYASTYRGTSGRFRSTASVVREYVQNVHRERARKAIADLKELDPEGWEAWYDDDDNVPNTWDNKPVADAVEARVAELKEKSTNLPTFDEMWEAFDFCREKNAPATVIVGNKKFKVFPSGHCEEKGAAEQKDDRS